MTSKMVGENNLFLTCLAHFRILSKYHPVFSDLKQFNEKVNENTMSQIIYHLFSAISLEKTTILLMVCWPLRCSKTRAQFRTGVKKFVTWINTEWPEAELRFVPSLLMEPLGIKLYRFLSKLSLFTVKLIARNDYIEVGMSIPDLHYTTCSQSEKLLIYQDKAMSRVRSYMKTREKLKEKYKNTLELLKELKKKNSTYETALEKIELSNQLVLRCPNEYQTKLVSVDEWKTAIFDWNSEIDVLNDCNGKKINVLGLIISDYCILADMKSISNFRNTTLDAEEILSAYNKKMLESWAKENELKLFEDRKLSLNHIIKICKINSMKILCFFQNIPTLTLKETQEKTHMLDELHKNFIEYYDELSRLKEELLHRCRTLELTLKEEVNEYGSRKLSNFFDSPLIKLCDEIKDIPVFSSPGLTGEQLLEETRRQILKMSGEVDNDHPVSNILASMENVTPVSRKNSQIPRLCKNKSVEENFKSSSNIEKVMAPPKNILTEGQNKNIASKNIKKKSSSSPLAISLLQKQTWDPPMATFNTNLCYPKANVLSSTVCSETSMKNERVPVHAVDESLSPILKNCIVEVDRDFEISSSNTDDYFESPSIAMPTTRPQTPKETREISRPSIESIIEKYKKIRIALTE